MICTLYQPAIRHQKQKDISEALKEFKIGRFDISLFQARNSSVQQRCFTSRLWIRFFIWPDICLTQVSQPFPTSKFSVYPLSAPLPHVIRLEQRWLAIRHQIPTRGECLLNSWLVHGHISARGGPKARDVGTWQREHALSNKGRAALFRHTIHNERSILALDALWFCAKHIPWLKRIYNFDVILDRHKIPWRT